MSYQKDAVELDNTIGDDEPLEGVSPPLDRLLHREVGIDHVAAKKLLKSQSSFYVTLS